MVEKQKIIHKVLLIAPIVIFVVSFLVILNTRTSPRLTVCGINVGLKTISQLRQISDDYLTANYPQSIQVAYQGKIIPLTIASLKYTPEDTAEHIFIQSKVKVGPLWLPNKLTANNVFYQPIVDREEINQLMATVSASLDKPVIEYE